MGGRRRGLPVALVAALVCSVAVLVPVGPVDASGSSSGDSRLDATGRRLAAGESHTCAIVDSGGVACWGRGDQGALGYGNGENVGVSTDPSAAGLVSLPGGRPAVAVDVGFNHTCALLDDGGVSCWGFNVWGQLGLGHTNPVGDNETPASQGTVQLPDGLRAKAIALGDRHTCVLLVDGRVSCWGRGVDGEHGYPGGATLGNNEFPSQYGTVELPGGRPAVAISAGGAHTCVILDTGRVACWGSGGILGYGNGNTIGDNETPAAAGTVALPGDLPAVAISAGSSHTCAILSNGTLTCWGVGLGGRLGYGNENNVGSTNTPADVGVVSVPGFSSVSAVSAGTFHTCAVLTNGSVSCWGFGDSGRLGYGSTSNVGDNELPSAVPPVQLPGGQTAIAVAAGNVHTCAILTAGAVVCWGGGGLGKRGYAFDTSTVGDDETPAGLPGVRVPQVQPAAAVSVGGTHICALLASGMVSCFGSGANGRLGTGSTASIGDDELPARGLGVLLPGHRTAVDVQAGTNHTCALLANGSVSCWGLGVSGQLGYGNTASVGDDETPFAAGTVSLPGGLPATAITVGAEHTCAILSSGAVSCWGAGSLGALGYAGTANVGDNETPASVGTVALPGGRKAVAISAGAVHTCVVLDNGGVSCWGAGGSGQLGYANMANVGDNETPASVGTVALPGGQAAVAISAGGVHTCAILAGGQVACWGFASQGQLGYGDVATIGDNETPAAKGTVALPGGQAAVAIDAGGVHTCALLANGRITCWGSGGDGRLGYGNTNSIGDNETPAQNPAGSPPGSGLVLVSPSASPTVRIGAGASNSCAVLANGNLVCWGDGSAGQLGRAFPTDVGDDEVASTFGNVQVGNPARPADLRPLPPARLVDTRPGQSTVDGQMLGGGVRPAGSTLVVPIAGRGGVPLHSTGVVLSVAAVTPSDSGFLTVYPCDSSLPTAASLNYQPGATTANTVFAKLSGSGTVCVFTNRSTHLVVDVHAVASRASAVVGLTPSRLADTRPGFSTVDGQSAGGGLRAAGSTMTLTVSGRGGVPISSRTVALNVVAVSPAAAGFLTVFPCGQPPPLAASMNYQPSVTTANFVYATTSGDGTICIFTNQATHLVVDVVAYHQSNGRIHTRHHPLTPTRLADTRPGFTTADERFAGLGQRAAGSTLVLPIAGRNPSAAARIASLSISAVTPTANGFVVAYPCDQPRPTAATFNYRAGVTRAVGTLASLSPAGEVCIFTNQATHLVVDLNGTTL